MRILIVEDNVLVAMMMSDELEGAGFEVVGTPPSSAAARDIVGQVRIDCALIDIDLTDGRTGLALAEYLFERFNMPVVFTTGQAEEATRCRQAVGIMRKPIDPDALVGCIAAIRTMLDGRRPSWPKGFQPIPEAIGHFAQA